MCFIEPNFATDLSLNISNYNKENGNITIISGKYEENIETILANRTGYNVFLYIDPYGIKALDFCLFSKFLKYGFHSIEMLINMNSFGFMRSACRAMRVDYILSESLDDLVEYEPTKIDASAQSVNLLNRIAGGDYWKAIVCEYKNGAIDGYQAEKLFSTKYKQRLSQIFTYVLDMPICIKSKQHPKYRMIHASNHEVGCILMADNMSSRSDELYIDIQHQGQLSLFEHDVQSKLVNKADILHKMSSFITKFPSGVTADKLIAYFFTEYGVLCRSKVIRDIWKDMEKNGEITVIRSPEITPTGKQSIFFTEDHKKRQSVTIKGPRR